MAKVLVLCPWLILSVGCNSGNNQPVAGQVQPQTKSCCVASPPSAPPPPATADETAAAEELVRSGLGPSLPPPELVAPKEGVSIVGPPRTVTLTWSAVPGAASYGLEWSFITSDDSNWRGELATTSETEFRLVFPGTSGQWRVWGIARDGRKGAMSAFRHFHYEDLVSRPSTEATFAAHDSGSLNSSRTFTPGRPSCMALLERANAAIGAQALASLKDSTISIDQTYYPGNQRLHVLTRSIAPTYFRQDTDLLVGGRGAAFTDGSTGWMVTPTGTTPMSASTIRELGFYDVGKLVLSYTDATRTLSSPASNAVLISSRDGQAARLDFDESSGLPVRMSYVLESSPGNSFVVSLLDWRDVGGMKAPFLLRIEVNGRLAREDAVRSFTFNTGLRIDQISAVP